MKCFLSVIGLASALVLLASCSFAAQEPTEEISQGSSAQTASSQPVSVEDIVTQPIEETVPTAAVPDSDEAFVLVTDHIPDLVVELKYATTDNFTGQVIYSSSDAYLRWGTVKKLIAVQQVLSDKGLRLKLWDGFRPPSAQFKLWEICPDPTFVSDPNNGFSSHSRGNTVDITVVDSEGREVVMPTGFDDFSSLVDRDYSDCSAEAAANASMLEQLMQENGFKGYYGEWWHFTDTVSYEVEREFVP